MEVYLILPGLENRRSNSCSLRIGAAVWFAAYAEIINPKYASTLKTFELNKLERTHAGPDQVASKLKELELSSGGSFLSYFLLFVFMTFFGCAVALVAAFMLKRKKA
jgi:hypothetical protein